jgi:hypothetical protein
MSPTPAKGYWLNGKRVPSVSTILGNLGWGNEQLMRWSANLGLQGIDYEAERQHAADVGTCAHELIDAFLHKRTPDTESFPAEVIELARTPFRAFLAWNREHQCEVILTERQFVSSALAYGGTPDAVVRMNRSEAILIDFKTSTWLYPKHIIQVVAYMDLIAECLNKHLERAIILRVGKDGEFKTLDIEGETITQAREAFYHLLQLHKLKSPLEKLTKAVNKPGAIPKLPTMTIMGEPVPVPRREQVPA